MPFLGALAGAVAVALGVSITAVVVASTLIVSAILMIVAKITGIKALEIASYIVSAAGFIYTMASVSSAVLAIHKLSLQTVGRILVYGIRVYINSVSAGFRAILQAINFSLALKMHQIAYMVSSEYRGIIGQFNYKLVKISDALGWGPAAFHLFLRDSRQLVMDVGASFGRSWDLSNLQWFNVLNGWIDRMNSVLGDKPLNVQRLIYMLDRYLNEDYQNIKVKWYRGVISTIDSILSFGEATLTHIDRIRDDVDRLVADLPDFVEGHIRPHLQRVLNQFDTIMSDYLEPNLSLLRSAIDALSEEKNRLLGDMNALSTRLAFPGDYLYEINLLPELIRDDQISKVSSLALSPVYALWEQSSAWTEDQWEEWVKIREAAKDRFAPPSWYVPEMRAPSRPARSMAEPRKSWFVGDF